MIFLSSCAAHHLLSARRNRLVEGAEDLRFAALRVVVPANRILANYILQFTNRFGPQPPRRSSSLNGAYRAVSYCFVVSFPLFVSVTGPAYALNQSLRFAQHLLHCHLSPPIRKHRNTSSIVR